MQWVIYGRAFDALIKSKNMRRGTLAILVAMSGWNAAAAAESVAHASDQTLASVASAVNSSVATSINLQSANASSGTSFSAVSSASSAAVVSAAGNPSNVPTQAETGASVSSIAQTAGDASLVQAISELSSSSAFTGSVADTLATESDPALPEGSVKILGQVIAPNTYRRLTWSSENLMAGFSEPTPVLVVNGATPGPTMCLVGAVHGDELNGIEMIRSVIFDIDPAKLTGTVIGVPVANIMGFRRNSRYLPDRRDWNRYFPGNTRGSTASRLAHSFFTRVITHCDALVDIHTGSFHRTNLPQLRADLGDESVAKLAQEFGDIAVLNSRGNPSSLRAAAVRQGIPAVTMEAGEPQHLQIEVVSAGVAAIKTLLAKRDMYGRAPKWGRAAPVYYRSAWLRANQSGILFSRVSLGKRVREGEVLGVVTDPITNARSNIVSPYHGRVLGMALDQVVLPGFAAYHIGVQTAEQILIEEGLLNEGAGELDDEDGDDAGVMLPAEPNSAPADADAAIIDVNQASPRSTTEKLITREAATAIAQAVHVADAPAVDSTPVNSELSKPHALDAAPVASEELDKTLADENVAEVAKDLVAPVAQDETTVTNPVPE